MPGKRKKPAKAPPPPPPPAPETPARRIRGLVLGWLAQRAASPIVGLVAAVLLGAACVFLVAAWQAVPQRIANAREYAKLTGSAPGKIVESWLALELDPGEIGSHSGWRPFSKASQCAVVEYEGDWGAPLRRAFCGTRFPFDESNAAPDLAELAPGVPFGWMRDKSGFVVPEIRLSSEALGWLSSHPDGFAWPNKPPPPLALAALRSALDRPVDAVVVGRSVPLPAFPLVFDPRHHEGALPAGYVARQMAAYPGAGAWLGCVVFSILGLAVWFEAVSFLLGRTPRWAFWVLAIVPLLTLPWWSEKAPRGVALFNEQWATVVAGMLDDMSRVDRLLACDPDAATLATGERLVWRAGEGAHAETFWSLLGKSGLGPDPAPRQAADAVLADLATRITAQVRALPADEQGALYARLDQEKQAGLLHAGLVFLRAAKEAIVDPASPPPLRRAARDFLWNWVLQPDDGMSSRLAKDERLRLDRELLDVPVAEIANMASAHWGDAQKAK
ncbi:MAG TPA: hypothetical protein VGE98_15185 [Thermoanaerobaculia bacterium]